MIDNRRTKYFYPFFATTIFEIAWKIDFYINISAAINYVRKMNFTGMNLIIIRLNILLNFI